MLTYINTYVRTQIFLILVFQWYHSPHSALTSSIFLFHVDLCVRTYMHKSKYRVISTDYAILWVLIPSHPQSPFFSNIVYSIQHVSFFHHFQNSLKPKLSWSYFPSRSPSSSSLWKRHIYSFSQNFGAHGLHMTIPFEFFRFKMFYPIYMKNVKQDPEANIWAQEG